MSTISGFYACWSSLHNLKGKEHREPSRIELGMFVMRFMTKCIWVRIQCNILHDLNTSQENR